ncbi:Thiamine-binding protein [Bifidobacterium dolichotidis]|uniref:Thiamine-binding protein n=1 Tax=Bifidobacterium dolichotidis TaxID=2306976 RepID=A0A430FRZ7_9BIFI|nr:thiamine-binding protein [Bifidobacterium dolichotidis]RSX55656.1 Thiamine-binding protein [Bifidobacterium dolichotidis]
MSEPIQARVPVDEHSHKRLNTVAAVSIAPSGVADERDGVRDELSAYVAQVVATIRQSGLPNETNAMFTNIEGDLDDVMRVVRDAAAVLAEQGYRTEVSLKLDIRPGYEGQIVAKHELVNELLEQ